MIVDATDYSSIPTHSGVVMEKKKRCIFIIMLSALVLLFVGCSEQRGAPMLKTAKILKEDQAQVAITLNKDFTNTVIAVNDAKRITPCALAADAAKRQVQDDIKPCEPEAEAGKGEILFEDTYKVTVRKGSICLTIISASSKYRFCDPPYNLGF
jgi:hypothetical protein